MLAKLLKYELKALSHFLLPIHILILIISIIGRFTVTVNAARFPTYALPFMLMTYSFLILVVYLGTYALIAVRFYKHLFTDEGYLTWTLPATAGQHLLSKTISAFIWGILDFITIMLSICLLVFTPDTIAAYADIGKLLSVPSTMNFSSLVLYWSIALLGEVLFGPIFLYLCIAIGQLFSTHRILGAVVFYFVLSTLTSIVIYAALILGGYAPSLFMSQPRTMTFFVDYMNFILQLTGLYSIIVGIASYIGIYYIMQKKLNLN